MNSNEREFNSGRDRINSCVFFSAAGPPLRSFSSNVCSLSIQGIHNLTQHIN